MASKTIMRFGDSTACGAIPTLGGTGQIARAGPPMAGASCRQLATVVEGHRGRTGGRTTVHDDPIEGLHKNGLKALPICLETHMPPISSSVVWGPTISHRFWR